MAVVVRAGDGESLLVVVGRGVVAAALVHLLVATEVGHDGEVATAAFDIAGKC